MHIRRLILQDLRTQLAALPEFNAVWIQRVEPARGGQRSITLHDESEEVDTLTVHAAPRQQDRALIVVVTAWIRGSVDDEKVESDMDAAALSIETGLIVPSNALDMILIGTTKNVSEDTPDLSSISLSYRIDYLTTERNPAV